MKTTMGQILDSQISTYYQLHKKLDLFTMDRYHAITKYKTAYYTLHLPTAIAMYMVGISSAERHKQAKDLLLQIGHYFQIQDDYLGCFADKKLLGKFEIDIQEGKCTWLIVAALERANSSQRKKLEVRFILIYVACL
nr:farnesyl pyrophosphate synthase [Kerria lacca]